MNLSMISVVNQLTSKGHHVEFYIRKDGGILIKKIDNEHFSGAKGNARARELVGTTISEARSRQLQYATRARRVKSQMPDAIEEEYRRVKKIWNKAFKAKKGVPHPAGYFSKARIKYSLEHFGKEETLRRISEAERYASGIAYSKNIRILATFVRSAGEQYNSSELIKLADDIEGSAYSIRDEWIQPAYAELYKLNTGNEPKEVARKVRAVLRL